MKTNNVLLTGYSGYLGGSILRLIGNDFNFFLYGRSNPAGYEGKHSFIPARGFDVSTQDFSDVSVIIHCAGASFFQSNMDVDVFSKINVEWTLSIARAAAEAGVKRFIFISSVKVNGGSSLRGSKFTEVDSEAPEDDYGVSKYKAEIGLKDIAAASGMEVVIIRPPLIYGPETKANFLLLLKLTALPIPLPFAMIHNHRSMIYVSNLVNFIAQCVNHPAAANQIFLVSDGEDVSLSSLVSMMRKYMGRSAWLIPMPAFIFKVLGKLTGRRMVVDSLISDSQIDYSKARDLLGWVPPYTLEQGIQVTVADFRKRNK